MSHDADHWYRTTLDSLLEGFQIIGTDWSYLYINPSAASQGLSTPERLKGRKMWEAYPGIERTPLFATLERCMRDRTPESLENLFSLPNAEERWFELRIEPVPEGLCIHSFDIHDRKLSQQALEHLNAELEERVSMRTRDLEERNDELDAFAHTISHDLRAPLRHVTGFVGMLGEDAAPRLTPEDLDCLTRITNATERMRVMIDSLLAFSRIARAPLTKARVPLLGIVRAAQTDVAAGAAGRHVEWTIPDLPDVNADPALLRMAFVNLFSNALKFTRGRTPATIALGADSAANETVISVRDNGVGFDMQRADKLFGVFQRLHSAADFEGTGIGLAQVRRVVARHGGRTWATGAMDAGATFYLSLPAEQS